MYNIKAISTEFDGKVFRSRLESYVYQYFKILINEREISYEIDYEPVNYQTPTWNPDFSLTIEEHVKLVEVKPNQFCFDLFQYLPSLSTVDCIVLFCPEVIINISENGIITTESKIDRIWKQAINDVKFSLSNG